MTDEELVARLRSNRPIPTLPHEAASRIEALTAENERLKKSAECLAESRQLAVKALADLEVENELYRQALKRITRYYVGLQSLIEDGADTPENRAKYYEGRV